jgi:hypothetical protein
MYKYPLHDTKYSINIKTAEVIQLDATILVTTRQKTGSRVNHSNSNHVCQFHHTLHRPNKNPALHTMLSHIYTPCLSKQRRCTFPATAPRYPTENYFVRRFPCFLRLSNIYEAEEEHGALVERYYQGKTEVLTEKQPECHFFPTQITQKLARNRTRASVLKGRILARRIPT